MRILFVNAYFMPETIAFSHLEKDLLEGFVTAGHEIEVISPTPTRNVSKAVYEQYKSISHNELYNGKVHVRRFLAPREGKNPLIRAFRYLWCNFREYQIGKKYKNIDAVFAVSTPPTQGLLAGKLAKTLRCQFIYSLQDVFPDSLVTTGLTHYGSILWKIGRKIENRTYAESNSIVVISKAMKKNLLEKGIDEEKIYVIPNWVDTEAVKPIKREDNKLFREFNLDPSKFIVVYAGNLGTAQGINVIVEAAELLKNNHNIQFVVFGSGSEYETTKKEILDRRLSNILLNPLLPQNRVDEIYSLGNVALITCKSGVGNSGMPSKTWSIMACNTPIIASFDVESDLAQILRTANAGICVEPGNAHVLAQAIFSSYVNCEKPCGGRQYVLNFTSKKICVCKYIGLLHGKT